MKTVKYLSFFFLVVAHSYGLAQGTSSEAAKTARSRSLTIEPGVGIHTNFGTDFLLANLIQWNVRNHLSFGAHTSFNINNPLLRDFNYVKTNYNYSFNQKLGVGASFYSKKSTHTFFVMAGFKYTSYEETLVNPNFNVVSTSINSMSPDFGLMYSFKRGWKKYFFTTRVYVPLYPWPIESFNIAYGDGNLNSIALEFGVGVKLK